MPDRTTKKGSASGGAGPGIVEATKLEVAHTLLAAARNCDDLAARAVYCAQARVLVDGAAADLATLRLNLEIVERSLGAEAKGDG